MADLVQVNVVPCGALCGEIGKYLANDGGEFVAMPRASTAEHHLDSSVSNDCRISKTTATHALNSCHSCLKKWQSAHMGSYSKQTKHACLGESIKG